jgi:signal transduction histidine kinase
MLILPIILGAGLISFELIYEISSSSDKISKEINDYEVQIKQRMKEEVEEAVYTADSYYTNNKNTYSNDLIKQQIIQLLENLKSSDVGYFFAADYQGYNLLGPGKNNNVYDIEDMNGFKVVQALIKAAKQGGGYVEYVMPPIDGAKEVPKISYVLPFQPFNCYIGAGVNLSEITTITNRIKSETMQKALQSIIITGILILLFILLFRRVNIAYFYIVLRQKCGKNSGSSVSNV